MDTNTQSNQNPHHSSPAGFLTQAEDFFYKLYKEVPWHLPSNIKEVFVKVGPILILILMVIAIPTILVALGIHALFGPAMMYGQYYNYGYTNGSWMLPGLISLVAFVLNAMALPGLFARSLKGWHLIFAATLVNALAQLIRFDIIGLIIGLAISLYILFEIKSYYH